ncbi:MAG: radical SAM protein [Acidobacteria bacterium]|nr:radical SAM protein [Acidobacteriota bacterium]
MGTGQYILYAPVRRAAFVANAGAVNFLAGLQLGVLDGAADPDGSLVELLRRLEILDAGPETPPITTFSGIPKPTSLTLFLTTTCNLRCTYCYAAAGDTPAKSMNLDTARRGIDFVAGNAVEAGARSFEINYHGGGEPTGNWRVMKDSLAYAREKAVALDLDPPRASSATNGVLRDDQIDWIIANLDGVSLSFDGLPSAHDKHRLTVLGRGSSDRVIHTVRRLDAAGFGYGVRVTVTADQIPQLPDSVEFICANFRPQRIQVEPAYQLGRWAGAPTAETDEFIQAFRTAQARAVRFGHEIFFSAARLGTLTNHFCGITQDTFALSPDGNVSACYEAFSEDTPWARKFFYGEPEKLGPGYKFELPILNNLRGQAVQHRSFCQGCFAKWTCAGDCYHKSLAVNGDVEFRGTDRCHITRELTKDQILAKIVSSGGLFWHEGPPPEGESAAGGKEMLL